MTIKIKPHLKILILLVYIFLIMLTNLKNSKMIVKTYLTYLNWKSYCLGTIVQRRYLKTARLGSRARNATGLLYWHLKFCYWPFLFHSHFCELRKTIEIKNYSIRFLKLQEKYYYRIPTMKITTTRLVALVQCWHHTVCGSIGSKRSVQLC